MNIRTVLTLLGMMAPCLAWGQSATILPCTLYTVATGGTAVTAQSGPWTGLLIQNGLSATDQGIGAAENITVNVTTDATAATAAANNETSVLQPGQTYFWGGAPATATVSVNAVTSGHLFTCKVFH